MTYVFYYFNCLIFCWSLHLYCRRFFCCIFFHNCWSLHLYCGRFFFFCCIFFHKNFSVLKQ